MESEVGIEFPPGVRDLSVDMSPPELLKTLKVRIFTQLLFNHYLFNHYL